MSPPDEVIIKLPTINDEVRIPAEREAEVRAELDALIDNWYKHVKGWGPKGGAQVVRYRGNTYLATRLEIQDLKVELYEFKRWAEGKEPMEGADPYKPHNVVK